MSIVLSVIANPKSEEKSRTLRLYEHFLEELRRLHPEDTVIELDLYEKKIDYLRENSVNVQIGREKSEDDPEIFYAQQFLNADKIILAAPLWNLGIPAILKAYLDYICVVGITFVYTEEGPKGLCGGKKAIYLTTRGGVYSSPPMSEYEMGDRYLRTILGFLGITDFTTIAAEGLDIAGADSEGILREAMARAADAAAQF